MHVPQGHVSVDLAELGSKSSSKVAYFVNSFFSNRHVFLNKNIGLCDCNVSTGKLSIEYPKYDHSTNLGLSGYPKPTRH